MLLKKIFFLIFFVIVIASLIIYPFVNQFSSEKIINTVTQNFLKAAMPDNDLNDLAYKIDDKYYFKKSQIEKEVQTLKRWLNIKDGTNFERFYQENNLNQNLIILEAIEDKLTNDQDLNELIWISVKDTIVKYYLKKQVEKKNPNLLNINIDKKEIEFIYNKNKDFYDKLGLSKEQIFQTIRSTLIKEKRAVKLKAFENQIINEMKLNRKIDI